MKWYVYTLLCDKKTFYIGFTTHIVNRLNQHRERQSFFTKQISEIKFVYCESYLVKNDALKREKQLKGWSHAKKQKLISGELGVNQCTEVVEELDSMDGHGEFTPKN